MEGGAPPDPSTYTGGTILAGKYTLNAVVHYGAGTYAGPNQAQYVINTTAQTIQIGERLGGMTYYIGMTYAPVDATTFAATVVCNTSPDTTTMSDYYFTVSGLTLTLTAAGSSDVLTLKLPALP
jgi:hypothetical protein